MSRSVETELPQARYSYGGDEFVFVEMAEAMSLKVNFRAMAITNKLEEEDIGGAMDICPSNASYMVRIDPEVLHPDDLISRLEEIDAEAGDIQGFELRTRVVDVPVMMEDPWTHETLMRFRDRHQDPDATDLEYSARINSFGSKEDFIEALLGSPWLVTMIGFVPGLPWCYQLVGRSPLPVLDVEQRLKDFQESIVFPKPGDIWNYRRIDREEFDRLEAEVEEGTFEYTKKDFTFHPDRALEDPHDYNEEILGVLYGD